MAVWRRFAILVLLLPPFLLLINISSRPKVRPLEEQPQPRPTNPPSTSTLAPLTEQVRSLTEYFKSWTLKGEISRTAVEEKRTGGWRLLLFSTKLSHSSWNNSSLCFKGEYEMRVHCSFLRGSKTLKSKKTFQARRLLWCPVYKAASTSWMNNLLTLANRSTKDSLQSNIRYCSIWSK